MPSFSPRLLGRLPGETSSAALAVNSFGVAVGFSDHDFAIDGPDFPPTRCAVWLAATVFSNGTARSLHAELLRAVGETDPCQLASIASDINDKGEVVGSVWRGSEEETEQGFFWSKTTGVILHRELGPTFLTGVNNHGETIGYFMDGPGGNRHVFVWSPVGSSAATMPPARDIFSWDITDAGQNAGCINNRVFTLDAVGGFRHNGDWCASPKSLLVWHNIVRPSAGGLNAAGLVVYSVFRNGSDVPVMWGANTNSGVPVGWKPGAATAISDPGRIVGWRTALTAPTHVAMTTRAGERIGALDGLPRGSATEAHAVNACGDIVGATFTSDGRSHAMLWKIARCDTP